VLGPQSELELNIVGERNGFRFPANHRLDVNAHFTFGRKKGRGPLHTLDFGVYNLYNRHNPIYYDIRKAYVARDAKLIADRNFVQVYLAPITPTLAYHLTFGGR